jgi:cyanophycinase
MRSVHLLGGGWRAAFADEIYGPFVAEAGGPIVLIVEDGAGSDEYAQRFVDVLERAGASAVRVCTIGDGGPPAGDVLAGAGGVLVGGGLTPRYHRALVGSGTGWLAPGVVYAGFSAGASIAPRAALVGGWLAPSDEGDRAVCNEDNAEDLERLTVVRGLALVPWTIDVHASQWGNLSRLVHVLLGDGPRRGFAIDEDTSLVVAGDGAWRVAGAGFVYEAVRDGDGVHVRAHTRGATGS